MTDLSTELSTIIGLPESETIAYKAVLPPSRTMAQIICSFANSNGGYLILGVSASFKGIEIKGLSQDFQAPSITHRAIDLLSPVPAIQYQYFQHNGKKLYAIKVSKSLEVISLEEKVYIRQGNQSILSNPINVTFDQGGYPQIKIWSKDLKDLDKIGTNSKHKFIEHCLSVLKIIDDLKTTLYPVTPQTVTHFQEGKILNRILFSSFVDNFETFLSDLLFEIYLAKPETLKSKQQVTVEEVLNCTDIQDFVRYFAKQKLLKMQKGSVKGFIKDNAQIRDLNILDDVTIDKIESILQIRHLYAHRNGIVDDKFMQYFPAAFFNVEYNLPIEEICNKLLFLVRVTNSLDNEAIRKYDLAVI